jgi:hypothetical protein
MKTVNLLKTTHPELIKEWDFEKNTYSWDTISTSSGKKVWWKCAKGHSWDTRVYVRTGKNGGTGCRYCKHNSPPTPKRNLAVIYPHLLEEWDYDKNDIDPHNVSPKSSTPRWWKCRYGHSWPTRVTHRANGSGCSRCRKNSSKQQVFLFCEVKYFFPNAEYRKKINGIECDIYLPDEKIGIEFDSSIWHKNRVDKDAAKVCKLRELGIEIISIREYGMPLVNRLTVGYNNNCNHIEITKGLMDLLGRLLDRQDLLEYSTGNRPVNEQEYLKELKSYPSSFEKTLATQNPELCKEWDYNANNGLTPNDFTPFTHHIACWICPVGHPYEAAISTRNRNKTGCPHCQNHSSLSYSRNKTREPIYPKRIRIRGKAKKRLEEQCQKLPLE